MGFLDKFLNKFTNKASDKLANKAVDKLFGKDKEVNKNVAPVEQPTPSVEAVQTSSSEVVQPTTPVEVNIPKIDPAQMAMMNAYANQSAVAGMAQANEIMKYLILNDNMEVIGVKDDAPDYLKIAFKNGKLNS